MVPLSAPSRARAVRSALVVAETGSTNADLTALAREGAANGTVLASGYQASGRGRLGRTWTAPPETSIALSVLVRPVVEPRRWTWLPLITGLAVAEGLRRATGVPAEVKWPNDVLVEDRKICGILAERVETPDGAACIIGMGINVTLTEDELPVPTATSLALAGATTTDRITVIATVLRAFDLLYRHWESTDEDTAFAASYVARCSTIGREVKVIVDESHTVRGTAEAVDDDGRLVVRTREGLQTFGAGDIVHLR